jgi:hypothetical protein
MRTDSNPTVYRWLVDTQEFDYTFEHILGKNNPIANGFSRLVANNMPTNIVAMLSARFIIEFQDIMGLNVRYAC